MSRSPSAARRKVLRRVADHLAADNSSHPLRIAIDGITAAGKTTFADELATQLMALGRPVTRVSMDGFHHPRLHRRRQGRTSAIGYYEDTYDFATLAGHVLRPAGEGAGNVPARIIDVVSDQAVENETVRLARGSVLIIDGTFLQNRHVAGLWDAVVFLEVEFSAACDRGTLRDARAFGSLDAAEQAYEQLYHPASQLYLDEYRPSDTADIVVENSDLDDPRLLRIGGDVETAVRLFSYGTLQEPDVQRASFGRLLDGVADGLRGHRTDWVQITDQRVTAVSGATRHPIVRATKDTSNVVPGTVFTLSTTELAAADDYEVNDYRRVRVQLASGVTAWTYLASG